MDGHAHTPPSYSGFSQYPTNPFGSAGGDESSNRASMPPPPPHGSSLPPLPPSYQTPPTGQQYGPQNFPGSSSSPSMLSHPSPSLLSLPPLSPSSIPYYPSETVANKDMASPQIPYMMLNSSSSSAGSSKDHKRGTSDNIIISGLNSLLARNNGIHPKPMEMPVGVSVGEKSSDEDVNVDVSNIGKKRRAGNEIAPPSKIWRSVSVESSLKRKSSHVGDVGNDNAYRGAFTADQMRTIAACDELKAMAATNPKYLKRVLSNRESAARSKERKALRLSELEDKVQTLETQIDTLTAELKLEKRERMAADEECKRLRIRLNGGEENAQLRDALIEQLSGEVSRLTADANGQGEEMSRLREEVSEYRRRESERMNANMLEQLNINQQFQENIDPMKLGGGGFGIKD